MNTHPTSSPTCEGRAHGFSGLPSVGTSASRDNSPPSRPADPGARTPRAATASTTSNSPQSRSAGLATPRNILLKLSGLALAAVLALALPPTASAQGETCVILLHGLGRTPLSMLPLKFALDRAGYRTVNQGYPSLVQSIEELADRHVAEALAKCDSAPGAPVHFVAHSLGGILVRHYLQDRDVPDGSRMVMLGPPNHGSELVDEFADDAWFAVMGPAALQLGTGAGSLPASLGPVNLEIGIVAGTRTSLDALLLQSAPLPEPNDGKVSLGSARLDGMSDFLAVDENHTFILTDGDVMEQVVAFLANGRFLPVDTEGGGDREHDGETDGHGLGESENQEHDEGESESEGESEREAGSQGHGQGEGDGKAQSEGRGQGERKDEAGREGHSQGESEGEAKSDSDGQGEAR